MTIETQNAKVLIGNNLDILPTIADNSLESIVTDPPYELGFMGKKWDSTGIAYNVELWRQCLRVLKPGGHLLAFSGSRTYHRMVVAIEDAGFEIRDMISWISNKTFPKSQNLSGDWKGWGTALKPTVEPIVMARKPLIGTVAQNVETHGTGALNIDKSRIATTDKFGGGAKGSSGFAANYDSEGWQQGSELGRWPANVILDPYTAELLDEQSGNVRSSGNYTRGEMLATGAFPIARPAGDTRSQYADKGGASRFFYVAKASKRDRNEGLEEQNFHPTVKPTDLMRYLVKLVTPPGGTVLDPFTGSGSTGKAAILEGFKFMGIEMTEDYVPIIEGRLAHAEKFASEGKGLF